MREGHVPGDLPRPAPIGYEIEKIDLWHCLTDTKDIRAKKEDQPVMVVTKR
jgi:hypothetical protein